MRTVPLVFLATVIAMSATAAQRDENSTVVQGTRSVLAGEPRLDRRISLDRRKVRLGELLEQLEAETGVQLAVDDRLGPASGYLLAVVIHDRPAREVLDAIASLYRHAPDRWYWMRDGRQYTLRHTHPPEALLQARQGFDEAFRLAQWQRRREYYAAPPPQREAMRRADPSLSPSPRDERFFSFISSLSPSEFQALNQGQRRDVPVTQLTPAQRDFLREEYRIANILGKPGVKQPEELENLGLYLSNGTVFLELGAVGGHGVLGGIWRGQAQREEDRRGWLGLGEDTRAPDSPVPAQGIKFAPEDLRIAGDTHATLLTRLARLSRKNVLLDFTTTSATWTYYNVTLQGPFSTIIKNITERSPLWKRRGEFFLFCDHDWVKAGRSAHIPWAMLRELRAVASKNDGYLRREDWFRLAALSSEQLDRLSNEFPETGPIRQLQLPLRLAATLNASEQAAIARPEGGGWQDWRRDTKSRLSVLFPPDDARQVRFLLHWDLARRPPRVRVHLSPQEVRPLEITPRPWNPEPPDVPPARAASPAAQPGPN